MTRTLALLATAALLGACSGDDSTDDNTDTDTGEPECTTTATSTFPASGATGVYYRTTVEVELNEALPSATFTLTDAGGAEVDGTGEWMMNTYVFTPSAPLAASTQFTASMDVECENPVEFNFTTSEVGAATDAASLVDNVYSVDLSSGRFVEPPGIGGLIGSFLTFPIMVEVTSATEAEIEMMGAIGTEGSDEQDLCTETINFPTAADFSQNPFFSIGPETTTISAAGIDVQIQDLELSGAFAPNADFIAGVVLGGGIDTRPLAGLVDSEDPAAICDLAGGLGITCEECPDNSGAFCLTLYVDSMVAAGVSTDLVERTAEDIAADPDCAE